MSVSFLGKKTIVVHILWKKRDIACSLCITVFPEIICELWGSTNVSAISMPQGTRQACMALYKFSQGLGSRKSSWFPTTHLILTYRYRRTESMLVCIAGDLVELHQYGLQKMKEQLSPKFTQIGTWPILLRI